MMYLLDTNVWIQLLNGTNPVVKDRFLQIPQHAIRLCSIVKAELLFGAHNSKKMQYNLQLLEDMFGQYQTLQFDDDAANHYGKIRYELFKMGKPIGPNDMMIAAIALANNATLVTHNTKEFSRVKGLHLLDWEEANRYERNELKQAVA